MPENFWQIVLFADRSIDDRILRAVENGYFLKHSGEEAKLIAAREFVFNLMEESYAPMRA